MVHHLLDVGAQGPRVPLECADHALELLVGDGRGQLELQDLLEFLSVVAVTEIRQVQILRFDVRTASEVLLKQCLRLHNPNMLH